MQIPSIRLPRILTIIGSQTFLYLVVGLLVVQALWIAFSAGYPMPFDEDFHLGVIRIYAHHLLPFWSGQPVGADPYGAIARDPSYLYHFLMSFPYFLISHVTHSQAAQVIFLRLINIGLFAGGLFIWQRVLLKSGASRPLVHSCLLAFVLIPVVPLLAAEINYDNLLIPLVATILLLTITLSQELGQYRRLNTKLLATVVILCMLTSVLKYAFLPMFVAITVFLLIQVRLDLRSWRKVWQSLLFGATVIERRVRLLLLIGIVVTGVLFLERYGLNMVRYHTPVPDCVQVLNYDHCKAYGPWIRDYNFHISKVTSDHNPIDYLSNWLYGMWLRLFFTLGGPTTDYETRGPFILPALTAIVVAVLSVPVMVWSARRIWMRYDRRVLLLWISVALLYVGVLWLDEYRAYLHTGQPVAINGRYLLPILLPVFCMVGIAWSVFLRKRTGLKFALVTLCIVGLMWGGGAWTFILRSNPGWYWPNRSVSAVNQTLKRNIGPLVPGFGQPTKYLR